jgi:hypothetical protein
MKLSIRGYSKERYLSLMVKTRNAHRLLALCFIVLYCVVLALRGWQFAVA